MPLLRTFVSKSSLMPAVFLLGFLAGVPQAQAEDVMSVEDIVGALQNSAEPTVSADQVLENLQNSIVPTPRPQATNSSNQSEPEPPPQQAKLAPALPQGAGNIDMNILFARNSDAIDQNSFGLLVKLADALTNPALARQRILIAGHTDARGSDALNLSLSQRRAQSVQGFLVSMRPELAPRLSAFGFGETQLKNVQDPESGENRRVQIVNLGQ
jgi:outer membrane protein OmpA-like peptidoglycan-associated protein